MNLSNEAKLKYLEKAIINSNKLKSKLEEKSKSQAQQMTQSLFDLEELNEQNISKIQDLEVKQKEFITMKEKNKEMVASLNQHVKIKELEDL